MNEFELIKNFFTKPITRPDIVRGIGDDCALVTVPAGEQLAITTDTLVSGIHFATDITAEDLGYKSLAVNLSDLAAIGATPTWVTLALTLPEINEEWLKNYCHGFFSLAEKYQVGLIGGDLTHGPLTITVQAHGLVPARQALLRSGAQVGDRIYVSNTLGDAGLALQMLNKKISVATAWQSDILQRLHRPEPRIELGIKLRGIASAAIDISDGLAADLNHILVSSQVGAQVFVDKLPLSKALRTAVTPEAAIAYALSAGDDYELCFTVPPAKESLLAVALKEFDYTCIGHIVSSRELDLQFTDGKKYHGETTGYQHF